MGRFWAAFGPVVVCALFWKRSNKYGALASMLVGGVMVFVWKYLIAPKGGAWEIYELLPAFVAACLANVIVSLATPAPSQEMISEFELVQKLYKVKSISKIVLLVWGYSSTHQKRHILLSQRICLFFISIFFYNSRLPSNARDNVISGFYIFQIAAHRHTICNTCHFYT